MNVKIVYRDGSRREFKPTFLSYEGSTDAVYEVDYLDLSDLEKGVALEREYISKWGYQGYPTLDENGGEARYRLVIVSPEKYPDVLQILEDGVVALESDGNGWLVQPSDY